MTDPAPSPAWTALAAHRDSLAGTRIESLFDADPGRAASLTFPFAGLSIDFSKQRVNAGTLERLVALAPTHRRIGNPNRADGGQNASDRRRNMTAM